MLLGVPAPKAVVQPTNEGKVIVNDYELFMVCPVEGHVTGILEDVVIRMAHDVDLAVSRRARGTQIAERLLGVCGIAGQCLRNLFVDDDVDVDTSLGGSLQYLVESPFLVVVWRSAQE